MKLAHKKRHSSLSIVHYPFSIDSNKFQFAGDSEYQRPGFVKNGHNGLVFFCQQAYNEDNINFISIDG